MNPKVIAYLIGRLVYATGIAMLLPFFCAVYWGDTIWNFAAALFISGVVGFSCGKWGTPPEDKLSLREGLAVTGLTWLVASLVASLPFVVVEEMSFVECIFEGTAGITGTGGSVIVDLSLVPDSVLLWRSMSNWLGGIGIVVIFVAVVPQTGTGAMRMFFAEGSGPTEDKIMPRIKSTANMLLVMYTVLSLLLVFILVACGLGWFDAVNNGMTAISTGGFSNRGGSIGEFGNVYVEIALIVFMLIGGGNFALYYVAFQQGIATLWKNEEFRLYIGIFLVIGFLIVLNLHFADDVDWLTALRYAYFHSASVLTSTCFSIYDFEQWPSFSIMCLVLLMLIGGCAGSTAGGIKVARILILFKMIYAFIAEKLYPRSIVRIRMNGKELAQNVVMRVALFFFIYISMAIFLGVLLVFSGVPNTDAMMVGISMLGNAGVGFGTMAGNFSEMPEFGKLACSFFMIMGRLEIFTIFAMMSKEFWRRGNW